MNSPQKFVIRACARAKVNLYLHILDRRQDGYHELDSLFVFGDIADVIEVSPSPALSFKVRGPFAEALSAEEDNLVLRAARMLADTAEIRPQIKITLTKNLPVAAGLGGGSADAAAALRALAEFWKIPSSKVDLAPLGLSIGSDVPACLLSGPCYVGGIGQRLEPLPEFPSFPLLLVNPRIELRTGLIFETFKKKFSKAARFSQIPPDVFALAELLQSRNNDLEEPAIEICPEIAEILVAIKKTKGCLLARLSGSGATCFGMYGDTQDAEQAAISLRRGGWWTEVTTTAKAKCS